MTVQRTKGVPKGAPFPMKGVAGRDGDRRLLLDLAAYLQEVSTPPDVGQGWNVQTAMAIADGASIGGDFMVFSVDEPSGRLQAVVVDTSGKGAEAATRSLMLAGAISGLLDEIPRTEVMAAINRHVLRRGWHEHFATAVHLDLSLDTGDYRLVVAGHPSPATLNAGSGRWEQHAATGPALGFLATATWEGHTGRLAPGDAMIVVTDGVIEVPGQDLDDGIDRMLGHAERLVLSDFQDGAEELLSQRRRAGSDDAQVLLITRPRI